MPAPESNGRHQRVVYWAASGVDDYGKAQVSAGVELIVRFNLTERISNKPEQKTKQIDATMIVNEDVVEGSIVWLGSEDDLPTPVTNVTDLYEIVSFQKTPDIKGRLYQRTAMLRKFRNSLPTIV